MTESIYTFQAHRRRRHWVIGLMIRWSNGDRSLRFACGRTDIGRVENLPAESVTCLGCRKVLIRDRMLPVSNLGGDDETQ